MGYNNLLAIEELIEKLLSFFSTVHQRQSMVSYPFFCSLIYAKKFKLIPC